MYLLFYRLPKKGETSSEHEERHMACISLSPCGEWLALASSRGQKQLGLWRVRDWTMESARPMARAASCVCFTPSSNAIIVAGIFHNKYSLNDKYLFLTY
jgi:WD40 repeat protein